MVCKKCGRTSEQFSKLKFYLKQNLQLMLDEVVCEDCYLGRTPEPEEKKDEKINSQVDIHKLVDDVMEKKDRYVTIFISESGTGVYVYPYENDKASWKVITEPITGKQLFLCGNCNRTVEQGYPYCPWCGEELGYSTQDVANTLEEARLMEEREKKDVQLI